MLTLLRDSEKYNQQVKPNTAFLNDLKNKLPEFFTKDGSFDLDKFKNQLREKNVNELSEGYQLDFIGKDYARRQAGEISNTVIVPDEKQNQGEGKNSKNLFFTGDNLEVLRHLQNNYQNKIDVIYIDPPYNTGSDGFVYPDSFEYSDDKLKEMFGLDDNQVERLKSIQGKSSHSAWLTFMYPRLALAKSLLKENGLLFIAIDENEDYNLQELVNELFGENNFISKLIWHSSTAGGIRSKFINSSHQYTLLYAKNIGMVSQLNAPLSSKAVKQYKEKDGKGVYRDKDFAWKNPSQNKNQRYWITTPDGTEIKPKDGYIVRFIKSRFEKEIASNNVTFKQSKNSPFIDKYGNQAKWNVYIKKYLGDATGAPSSILPKEYVGLNNLGSVEVEKLMGDRYFDNPKPTKLIKYLFSLKANFNAQVLDFFAGSSTTADAIMQLNAEDGGHRKFIMVQLPEKTYQINKDGKEVPTKGGKAAYDDGFKSIDEISRECIRRAAKKIKEENELTLSEDFDGSFKHYRVVAPTKQTLEDIDGFDPNNTNLFTNMVDGFSSNNLNVAGDASGEQTILTTWLAQDGYAFDIEVMDKQFDNYHAHLVDDRLYLINEGWSSDQTKELLNQLGKNELHLQSIVLFGYSFNIAELRELESGLKQLDNKVTLIKRY